MTKSTIHFTVQLAIHPGKFEAFETLIKKMADLTSQEPGALGYEFFLSADRAKCHLLETYVDASAVLAHLKGQVVRDYVPQLLQVATLTSFEVYGDPGPESAKALAGVGANIYTSWQGYAR